MKKPERYKAWDKKNKKWVYWSTFIPENLRELAKKEGLVKFQKY